MADPFYTPFGVLDNGVVRNAPIIADAHAALDRVVRLDPVRETVRIRLSRGYVNGNTVWYSSTEASDPAVAALECATLAPAMRAAPGEGMTTGSGSTRTGILAVINGETGTDNPERQGLRSAILDDRAPLNIVEHSPDPSGKNPIDSPAWDLNLVRWTATAIRANQRGKLFSWAEVQSLLASGAIVAEGANAKRVGPPTLNPARVVINCPVIAVYVRRTP